MVPIWIFFAVCSLFAEIENSLALSAGDTLADSLTIYKLNNNCLKRNCPAVVHNISCDFLHGDAFSLVKMLNQYKSCMKKLVCGYRLEPLDIPQVQQTIEIPGHNGHCLIEASNAKLYGASVLSNLIGLRQGSLYSYDSNVIFSRLRWSELNVKCLFEKGSSKMSKFSLISYLINVIGDILEFLFGKFGSTEYVHGKINKLDVVVRASLTININSTSPSKTYVVINSNPTINVIALNTSIPVKWQPAIQPFIKQIFASKSFAMKFVKILKNSWTKMLGLTVESCTKING